MRRAAADGRLHRPQRFAAAALPLALLLGCQAPPSSAGLAEAAEGELASLVDGIFDAWRQHDLVCLGETHGSVLDAALRQALVADPRFTATVDVVVLEMANPVHQDLLDRLVLGGEMLARRELAPVWRDAGLGETWELPMYEDLLRALARANRAAPAGRKVRAIGGALPIDWSAVERPSDLVPFVDRRGWIARLVTREVFGAARRGLAVFGAGHCERRGMGFPAALPADQAARTWSAFSLQGAAGVRAGRRVFGLATEPRLVPVTGTSLAASPAGDLFFAGHATAGSTLGDLLDAIVYHGDRPDVVIATPSRPHALANEASRRAQLWNAAVRLAPKARPRRRRNAGAAPRVRQRNG